MQHAVDKIIFLTDWSYNLSKSCRSKFDPRPLRHLGSTHLCQPGLCLGGPTKSTWNPPHFLARALPGRAYRINLESTHFFWPGLCLEGIPNELGIHCGPSLCIPYNSEGKGDQVGRRAPHTMLCWRSWMSLHPGLAPPTHFGC